MEATKEAEPQAAPEMNENSDCQENVNPLKTIRFSDNINDTIGAFQVVKPRAISQENEDSESEDMLEDLKTKLADLVEDSEDLELNKTGESLASFRDTDLNKTSESLVSFRNDEPKRAKNKKLLRLFPPKNVSTCSSWYF